MTEPYEYDENDDGNDGSEGGYGRVPRAKIRAWEAAEKQAKKDAQELADMRRELAFSKAGIDGLTERQTKALLSTIDGDLTGDAVRAAAEELGFVKPAAGSEPDADQAAMDRMAQASSGATDPGSEDSIARLERAMREGGQAGLLAQIQADGHLAVPSS